MHLAVATTSDPDVDTRCVSIIFMSIAGPPMTQMQFESCLHAAQHETPDFTPSASQACFCLEAALAAMYMFATFLHACR